MQSELLKYELDKKVFDANFPFSWARSMEADSRRRFLKCLECEFEESYRDIGGIRSKATGDSRNLRKCPNCGKRSWHQTYKKEQEG